MRKFIYGSLTLILLVVIAGYVRHAALANNRSVPPDQTTAIQLDDKGYWATSPTGPDFQGVTLIPFQAKNPDSAAREATQQQVQPLLSQSFNIDNIQVSASGEISGASHDVNDFSEVMVYLDPTDPAHLLGASKFFYLPASYLFYTGVFESLDAGLSWSELQPPGVEDYSLTSDPVTTFDDQGNGYFTLLTRGPTGVDMLKKPPESDWESPVVVDRTTSTDKQWIMGDQNPLSISPYAGNLYMSWTSFGGPVTGIVISRSTNRNLTWSSPISVAGGDVQGSIPGVAPDGTVYVVFGRNIFYGPTPGTIEFVKSVNGGASFTSSQVAAHITAIPYVLPDPFNNPIKFRSPASLPAFAVSPANGDLYIAWADYRNGDADIYFASSANGGDSWTDPVRLNDDPLGNGIDQFQPQVSVAANGRVAVMWFDRRLPCPDLAWIPDAHVGKVNACINTFVTRSYDNGQTWTANARASAQTWDWTINLPIDGSGNGFIGDYQGIASSNDYDFPFWNATAQLGENPQNYQEIFTARLPVPYYNLSGSMKIATPEAVGVGGTITYTLNIENLGLDPDPGVVLTDSIPLSTSFVTGSLTFPSGSGSYDPSTGVVTWTGQVVPGSMIPIQFQVLASAEVEPGQIITNTTTLQDSSGKEYELTASSVVNASPVIVSASPADGDTTVSITSTLAITFSQPMSVTSLAFSIQPDPGGWNETWNGNNTAVRLTHRAFEFSQVYSITVSAEDIYGFPLTAGPVPNPWSFATLIGPPPMIVSTDPMDGAANVPITQPVTVSFSEPVISSTLVYTVSPEITGFSVLWNPDFTSAVLTPVQPFLFDKTYLLNVNVQDEDGFWLSPGAIPNPWSFSTEPPSNYAILLPVVTR